MRIVLQRVARASVSVGGEVVGSIDRPGLVVLVGVTHDDGPAQVELVARKNAELRILRDERSVLDGGAPVRSGAPDAELLEPHQARARKLYGCSTWVTAVT